MKQWATVEREGFKVPLIGIPLSETLEECDCCHEIFSIRQVRWTGKQMLCPKCDKEPHDLR